MKNLTFGDLCNTNAYISTIDDNHVDDNYEVEGRTKNFMRYTFADNSFNPVYLEYDSEIEKSPIESQHLGAYMIEDLFGKVRFINLSETKPFILENVVANVSGTKFYKFFISYNDGETTYNAPSVICLNEQNENLNLQILEVVSNQLGLDIEPEEKRYATTSNFMPAQIESIEEINLSDYQKFKTIFFSHAY